MSQAMDRRSVGERVSVFIASIAGLGFFPIASGTACSAVITVLAWWLPPNPWVQLALIAGVMAIGTWTAAVSARRGAHDPSFVVIDEAAGQMIACLLVPKTIPHFVAAFLLFRLFDIGKWAPMKQLERLPGGWGIMADDLAAGMITRLLLLLWTQFA